MLVDPVLYHVGKVVDVDDDIVDAGLLELREDVFQQGLAADRNKGLGHCVGERLEACAQTGSEYHGACGRKDAADALLAVADVNLDAELVVDMLRQVLCAIDAAVLASRAAKAEHEAGEASLNVTTDVGICQAIDALQEGEDFAVVFEETDDGFVEAGQLFVGFVASGIVGAAAVEDVASAVAARVLGNTLPVGEAEDAHDEGAASVVATEGGRSVLRVSAVGVQVGSAEAVGTAHRFRLLRSELRQADELREHFAEVGIGAAAFAEQLAQVVHCRRDAVEEVPLALEVPAETVGTEYLKQPEEHAELQPFAELLLVDFLILLEALQVDVDELTAQLPRVVCRSLPEETGYIVLDRAATSSLEVYEVGIPFGIEHNVASLEVAVHEGAGRDGYDVACQKLEGGFEFQFVKIKPRSFKEAVFEIVEVEEDVGLVERGLRIAMGEVEAASSANLEGRQCSNRAAQQFAFTGVVASASLASALQGIEEREVPEVGLQVAQPVPALCYHLRYRQPGTYKVGRQVAEGMILVAAGSDGSDEGAAVRSVQPVIVAVAPRSRQFFGFCHLESGSFAV